MFAEDREQLGSIKEQNCTPNQATPADNLGHEQTSPFADAMEEQRESIPSMETPLEAEEHEGEAIREETQTVGTDPVDPPVEGKPEDETLGDANQPGNTPFSKFLEDEAYLGEDSENDNFSGGTIALGSPEK